MRSNRRKLSAGVAPQVVVDQMVQLEHVRDADG
jgi:hypothetical protein